jgi:pyruvate/2-oxoglutarate dehydrogenase complex dihydrolipoamide acyltransferase (E2) component
MPRHEVILPDLGLGDQPMTLSVWLVSPGHRVARRQPILEILAGPATVDLPSPTAGTLVEILVEEDEPVAVGQRLAIIESEGHKAEGGGRKGEGG